MTNAAITLPCPACEKDSEFYRLVAMSTHNPATIPYTSWRGVENLVSGNRTRQTCGFFISPRQTFVYGREGTEIPEYRPPSLRGFEPPSPPFWGIAATSKTVRNPAMLATIALYPASACLEVRL